MQYECGFFGGGCGSDWMNIEHSLTPQFGEHTQVVAWSFLSTSVLTINKEEYRFSEDAEATAYDSTVK